MEKAPHNQLVQGIVRIQLKGIVHAEKEEEPMSHLFHNVEGVAYDDILNPSTLSCP